jgi:hypothetical protein
MGLSGHSPKHEVGLFGAVAAITCSEAVGDDQGVRTGRLLGFFLSVG